MAKPVQPSRERLLKRRRDRLQPAGLTTLEQEPRHLLDKERHAAGALAYAFDDFRRQRALRRHFGDYALNERLAERRQRNNAMVRPQAPGRAEFRSRRRQDEERSQRAAIAERGHEINRGRVELLQVLKDEDHRLDARAGDCPFDHRRQLPAANLLRRKAGQALGRDRNID